MDGVLHVPSELRVQCTGAFCCAAAALGLLHCIAVVGATESRNGVESFVVDYIHILGV